MSKYPKLDVILARRIARRKQEVELKALRQKDAWETGERLSKAIVKEGDE